MEFDKIINAFFPFYTFQTKKRIQYTMKIYFLSSTPCALTLNGVFYGVTDSFERSAELALSDRIYAQFSPEGGAPIGFFITEEITSRPPAGCEVYLVKDGVAIHAYDFPPVDFTLRPLTQKREGDRLATLFFQGKLQLHVESERGYFNATLPPFFAPCNIQFHGNLLLLHGENALGVFTLDCRPLLMEKALSFEVDGELLRATLPLSDSLGRYADCVWRLSKDCELKEFALREESERALPEGLLAYAFFETVLLKGDYSAFLSDELRADGEKIAAFLGEFTAVLLTENPKECGLVRKKGERLFVVEYYAVDIEKGKITDVRG